MCHLNGLSASLILFKFRNISHFFVSSSIAISNGLSLFSVAFPNLTALLTSLLVISILQMFLHSPTIFWISSSLLVSGLGLSDSGSPKTIIFFLLFCHSLSSISLSFSDFWITSSTFVLVPVVVDHDLSSLSSPPSFLILFSIFSILLCSLSISMVSALLCRSTSKLLNFSLIFFVYSLHLSSIIAFLAGSLQALQNHAVSSASLLAKKNCKMHQLCSHIWCSTISGIYHSISFLHKFTFVNIPLHLLQIRAYGASCSFTVLSHCTFFPFFLSSVLPFFLPLLLSGSVIVLCSKFYGFLLGQFV